MLFTSKNFEFCFFRFYIGKIRSSSRKWLGDLTSPSIKCTKQLISRIKNFHANVLFSVCSRSTSFDSFTYNYFVKKTIQKIIYIALTNTCVNKDVFMNACVRMWLVACVCWYQEVDMELAVDENLLWLESEPIKCVKKSKCSFRSTSSSQTWWPLHLRQDLLKPLISGIQKCSTCLSSHESKCDCLG